MEPTTIKALDQWMTDNCFNTYSYAIGNRNIDEGFGLMKSNSDYQWYFTERGQIDVLNTFKTEKEAVIFAFKQIKCDVHARTHMVGFCKTKNELIELTNELNIRGIPFTQDEIPYGGLSDPRYRVFVVGCDILKTKDLQDTYNNPK